jgi:hypothetical protein
VINSSGKMEQMRSELEQQKTKDGESHGKA